MEFEKNRYVDKIGEKFGFFFSYLLFTTMLFIFLVLLNELPLTWNYIHVAGITLTIVTIGLFLKRLLN